MIRSGLFLVLSLFSGMVAADEQIDICHGYGCLVQDRVHFREARLAALGRVLQRAVDAAEERRLLAGVIGQLYAWAGEQSEIRHDRGGNYADSGPGRMDCIDHSTSTTRLLQMLAERRYLRFHRVLDPVVRHWAMIFPVHWSAVIEERAAPGIALTPARFVVDSWFVDNGQPAVVLPLEDWKEGAGPDV